MGDVCFRRLCPFIFTPFQISMFIYLGLARRHMLSYQNLQGLGIVSSGASGPGFARQTCRYNE